MCVATIGKLVEIKGSRGICSFRGVLMEASIALVPKVQVGDYVVVHAGFVTEIVKDLPGYYQNTVATDAYSRQLLDAIETKCSELQGRPIRIMNFCGSHEHTINHFGLRGLLPNNLNLVSGPGCPVCVTPINEIYMAIEACQKHEVITTVYSDMLTIPTPWGSLEQLRSEGANIKLVNNINQSVQLAREVKQQVVHFAVGFETTAPSTGATIMEASDITNFSIISSHRLTLPAMEYVLRNNRIDAIICPGNVAAIIGIEAFQQIYGKYQLPIIITGFEPIDVLESILKVLCQLKENVFKVENQYSRVVRNTGNQTAKQILDKVFRAENSLWRGLGTLPESRLVLNDKYERFNAETKFNLRKPQIIHEIEVPCSCNEILRGEKQPSDCPLFGKDCIPESPKGPCMTSSEGACKIRYVGSKGV